MAQKTQYNALESTNRSLMYLRQEIEFNEPKNKQRGLIGCYVFDPVKWDKARAKYKKRFLRKIAKAKQEARL